MQPTYCKLFFTLLLYSFARKVKFVGLFGRKLIVIHKMIVARFLTCCTKTLSRLSFITSFIWKITDSLFYRNKNKRVIDTQISLDTLYRSLCFFSFCFIKKHLRSIHITHNSQYDISNMALYALIFIPFIVYRHFTLVIEWYMATG